MEQAACNLLAYLEQHGYLAYKVGGCVRDQLLGLPIHDIDIATSATPEEVLALFPRVIPTGIKYGTVMVLWGEHTFEVTTFRVDGTYRNLRQPDGVVFVDEITLDLARRDFTINAMAMDRHGQVMDPFGGKEDLQCSRLRAVGDPDVRFAEDALRLLRGIRFAARFDLKIEEKTWAAMCATSPTLTSISRERIRDELVKMIEGDRPLHALHWLSTPRFLPFPDLEALFAAKSVATLPGGWASLSTRGRWVGLWHQAGWSIDQCRRFLRTWKFSNRTSREKLALFTLSELVPFVDEHQAKRFVLQYGLGAIHEALHIRKWLEVDRKLPLDPTCWNQLADQIQIRSLRELAVRGTDLMATFDRPAGPWIGMVLHTLFERVAFNGLPNQRERLLREAGKVLNEL